MNEFFKARVTLFCWYLLINFFLLTIFTVVAFQAEKQSFNKIERIISNKTQRPVVSALLERRLSQFTGDFREQLLYFDIVLLLLSAASSWFLSGKTLKPIEDMLKSQQEFSADASHELRTPLTTIIMEIEAIKRSDESIPKELYRSLESIKEDALKMRNLVNNLLTLVRVDSPTVTKKEVVDLNLIAKKAFDSLYTQAVSKRLDYKFETNEKIKVNAIPDSLEQAIAIILENAIKYTPFGEVVMCIKPVRGNTAVIEIRDTGVGIPQSEIPHIFERLYRARTRTKEKGTGLGLSIAKKIIDTHRGKIEVKSIIDEGSTFTIYIPIES